MRHWLITCLLAALPGAALAQMEPGDPIAGQRLATTWCANCHSIAPGGPGPATDIAPSFAAIAALPSTTSMSLRAYLRTPHANMPDYRLSREELDDIVAYLLTVRRLAPVWRPGKTKSSIPGLEQGGNNLVRSQ